MLPNLILIGGVKCGSTTLYDDLVTHPEIFGASIKEPGFLALEKEPKQIKKLYRQLYKDGVNHRWRIDGSTRYGVRHQNENVAQVTYDLLGDDAKIIYIIREPIGRIISHYRQGADAGSIVIPLDHAVSELPNLIDTSRYGYQIKPWIDLFGESAVFVTEFSYYCGNRAEALSQIQRFFGAGSTTRPN